MGAADDSYTKEEFSPSLDATAEPPALFDGTTRFYTCIARNYMERGCSVNKGESLDFLKYIDEHFEGPSLLPDDLEKKKLAEDLLPNLSDSFDEHIERPSLLPDDLEKKKFAEELLAFIKSFNGAVHGDLPTKGEVSEEDAAALNKLEEYLSNFSDGSLFLGRFSLVDMAYVPFIERFQIFFADIKSYDIAKGRPKLALWIEELNKIVPIQKPDMILKC